MEVKGELLGAVEGDQCGYGDEAAVALGEAGALPDVGVEDFVGEFGELGGDVADQVLGGEFGWWCWHGFLQVDELTEGKEFNTEGTEDAEQDLQRMNGLAGLKPSAYI